MGETTVSPLTREQMEKAIGRRGGEIPRVPFGWGILSGSEAQASGRLYFRRQDCMRGTTPSFAFSHSSSNTRHPTPS